MSQEKPELVTVDDYLIDDPNRTSMHRIRGDSMRDSGLYDGDLLVVEHNRWRSLARALETSYDPTAFLGL